MNCYKCGKEIEEDSNFCEFCGLNIKEYIENMKENNDDIEDSLEIESDIETKTATVENSLEIESDIETKTATVEKSVEDLIIDNLDKRTDLDINYKDDFFSETLKDENNSYKEETNNSSENITEEFDAKELELDNSEIIDSTNEEDEFNEDIEEESQVDQGKKFSNGIIKKIIIAVIIINVLIGIGGVIYLRSVNNPKKVVDTFIEALKNSDYDKLSAVAVPKDSTITLNETMGNALFNLYNNNIGAKESIEKTLNDEVIRVENDIPSESVMVTLIKEKRGLYSTYKVGIEDYDIELKSSLGNVKVTGLNEEMQIDEADSSTVVKDLLLGQYDVSAIATDNYGFEYNYKESVVLTNTTEVQLSFPYTSIDIYKPDFEVTGISVNGKAYSNLAFTNNVLHISPIPLNSEVKLESRAPWGEVLSASYTTNSKEGYNYFQPEFKVGEETKVAILNKASEFYKNMYTFYNKRDIASLEAMNYRNKINRIDDFVTSLKNIEESKAEKYSYYSYSFDISNLAADKEFRNQNIASGEFKVYVEATLQETSVYYDSEGKVKDNRGNTSKSNQGYYMTVKNIDGNWIVTEVNNTYGGEKINQIYNYN